MIRLRLRLAALGCAVSLLAGCDVATVNRVPSSIAQNTCNSDSDCSPGDCVGGQCRAFNGTIDSVLFEVTPPADGSPIAGVQFLKAVNPLPGSGTSLALDLDLVSQVVGQVIAGNKACDPRFKNGIGGLLARTDDASISAAVTLTASSTTLGLYSPRSAVKSQLVSDSYFQFSVNVPAGDYDIYIEPGAQEDNSCPVPPQLRRGQHLNGGSLKRTINLPEPSTFELHVSWPASTKGNLDGWLVDMLDPVSGRVISNRVRLTATGKEYVAKLAYFPVVVGEATDTGGGELVRLSPADGIVAPTVLLARSGLCLVDANLCTVAPFTLPDAVTLHGQVAAQSTPRAVASTVTLAATAITGIEQGVLASFTRTVAVGKDGQFAVQVLPGHYRVSAVPTAGLSSAPGASADANLAAVTQDWDVASTPDDQSGKVVTLETALKIYGVAKDSELRPVTAALVQATASPASLQSDVLQQALGETSYVPRASSGVVDENGVFYVLADRGTFDVSVRPLASTGFGWQLFPDVVASESSGLTLESRPIALPIAYSGTVTTPGPNPVPNALIRAYIYLAQGVYEADPSKADSVLQVAETRSNKDGSFDVLIPAAVNEPTN